MMQNIFVTAIGTEIGKTYVSAATLLAARKRSLSVHALKPLMSGFSPDEYLHSDAGILLTAAGEDINEPALAKTCLHALPPALAPNVAARQIGVEIDDEALIEFCRVGLETKADFHLIEGAGGVLSPATDTLLQVDLIATLNLPVILVAANYLGAVSHTLTALESLERRNINVSAIVVSQPTRETAHPDGLIAELARLHAEIPVFAAPFEAPATALGEAVLSTLERRQ
ncbi:dethiobiotin synthase [Hyphococcus lacteus]|uniref:ATP-dependent dethiobiotin synthetase BioD n=1 Tax=Hyphococcus lacteus TaxID=3143536 RepID=A0ABV3Z5Q2_9PROT